jgi:transcriptional regulator with GAF, ATPase, and Fis domain
MLPSVEHEDDGATMTQTVERGALATVEPTGRLTVVHPPELASSSPLPGSGTIVVGRKPPERGFVLAHPTVSREHIAISWIARARGWAVKDCGSRNGAWSDGVRLGADPLPVTDGTVIRFGDVLAVVELPAEAPDDAEVSRTAIPGESCAAMRLRAAVGRAGRDPASALVIGETGAGKELVAHEIHRLSARTGPLVSFNCAELNATVVESQLFGHERGAFTGATASAPGLFRAADGGTLFLDEIGELPLELQPKLLRAIQTGDVIPVGGTRPVHVDVRVVAATNRDLEQQVREGSFRRDLYARLALHVVHLPPLRGRRADLFRWIAILEHAWAQRRGRAAAGLAFTPDAAELLLRCPWPENLRGLDRLVHAIAGDCDGRAIGPAELPPWVAATAGGLEPPTEDDGPAALRPRGGERVPAPDRAELLAALEAHGWVIQEVARHFGRDRRQVYRWMDALGISRGSGS